MERLTEEQKEAIFKTDKSMAVVAAAGSGKTTVLINRCLNIIGENHSQLDRLLAITFTEKAAAELKTRLRPHLPPIAHHRITTSWIGTFHSLCARIIRQHAPVMSLDPAFTILDENAAQLIMRKTIRSAILSALDSSDTYVIKLVDALDFRNTAMFMEDLMNFRWHAKAVLEKPRSDDSEEKELLEASRYLFESCNNSYQEALSSKNALDFQELEILTLKLLDTYPDILKSYQRRFKNLLIDEFQDTNDIQTELILKLYKPGINILFLVGDPRQSIYRFRGANVDCFSYVLSKIRKQNGTVVPLMRNFRSHPSLIDFFNLASEQMSDGLFGSDPEDAILKPSAEKMIAARSEDLNVPSLITLQNTSFQKMTTAERRKSEAQSIATFITNLTSEGKYKLGEIVCLFQALTNVEDYEVAFKEKEIPYRFFGGRGLLDRQEICDLMHALRYAAKPNDDVALIGLLRSPLIGLSDNECANLAGPDGKSLKQNAKNYPSCRLLSKLEIHARHMRPSELLRFTVDETGYEWMLSQIDRSGGMRANIDRLILIAESLEEQTPTTIDDFISFISHLRERAARLGDPPATGDSEAVHCMTVHAAKGLEFPVVILPDLIRQEPSFSTPWIFHRKEGCAFKLKDTDHPFGQRIATQRYELISSKEKTEADAERARLLYVAMTRAKDMLIMPIHDGDNIKGKWHEWLKPIVINNPKIEIINKVETSDNRKKISSKHDQGEIITYNKLKQQMKVRQMPRIFSVSQLEAFDRCPHEYFLKYLLNIPASDLSASKGSDLPANIRGSIVHRVLENLNPQNASELANLICEACFEHDVYPEKSTTDSLLPPIKNFMNTSLFKKTLSGNRETRFDWKFGDDIISGFIDWYKPTDGGMEIIDFKTDKVDESGATLRALEYDLQMITYALALEKATGIPTKSTTLVFLTPNVTKTSPVSTERKNQGIARISKCIKRIKANDFDIAGIRPPCEKCPYHNNRLCWKDKLIDHD